MTQSTFETAPSIAQELGLPVGRIATVIELLGGGATVPFIARYRKEATGEMDEVQIRTVQERHEYLSELEARRSAILESISSQGKLTAALEAKIRGADSRTALEDLYLPYRPKRRTRATMAKERGLEPLAELILAQAPSGRPRDEAQAFVSQEKDVPDVDAALAGARDIIAEMLAEHADLRGLARDELMERGAVVSEVVPEKATEPTRFEQYYDYQESIKTIPSHRYLAVRRGELDGTLRVKLVVDEDQLLPRLLRGMGHTPGSAWAEQLELAVRDGYKRLMAPSVENEVRVGLKMRSDRAAVEVFAENLKNLLLAPLLGGRRVVGIDPGLRTGCKCVAVDETGRFLDNTTVYLTRGDRAMGAAAQELTTFLKAHKPFAVAVGNGTGGRETEAFLRQVLSDGGVKDITVVQVSEAGASVYSASDIAREEFPDLDLTIRGAISIARRLQDPLAELVKIDPKAIGVGQYQHDVHQPLLSTKLDEVVEDCVNAVGVELNTASAPLLARVSGIGPTLAGRVVAHREANGAFKGRSELLKVPGLGKRTFELSAGFLRVHEGKHPLDASAVHPERYALVEAMAKDLGVQLGELVGNEALVDRINLQRYLSDEVGEPTLRDILAELKKPGRDPREAFEPPRFRDDVNTLHDLVPGMQLEGVVTNVTAFGAFVDIGVHQDGLVHISRLSERFIKDPAEVVKVGDKLKIWVLEVDLPRKRISLSAVDPQTANRGDGRSDNRGDGRSDNRGDGRSDNRGGQRPGGQARPERRDNNRQAPQRGGQRPQSAPKDEGFKNNPFANALGGLKIKK